jgi:hypothetical protein
MIWAQLLAYVIGTVKQELLLRNEYLTAENRILKAQIKGRLLLSQEEKATLAEIAHGTVHSTRRACRLANVAPKKKDPCGRIYSRHSKATRDRYLEEFPRRNPTQRVNPE